MQCAQAEEEAAVARKTERQEKPAKEGERTSPCRGSSEDGGGKGVACDDTGNGERLWFVHEQQLQQLRPPFIRTLSFIYFQHGG